MVCGFIISICSLLQTSTSDLFSLFKFRNTVVLEVYCVFIVALGSGWNAANTCMMNITLLNC